MRLLFPTQASPHCLDIGPLRVALVLTALFTAGALSGCASMTREPAPQLTGTFSGQMSDGRALTLTLQQTDNTVTGQGRVGGQPFSVSALTSPRGPMVMTLAGGRIVPGSIGLSGNGGRVTVLGLGEPVTLERGGSPVTATSGPFAGRYAARGPTPLWLELQQAGDLLAGTGFVRGRPVAVAGKVTGPDEARGSVLFSDESRNGVKVTLSDDRRSLTVTGIGGIIEMGRQW